MFGEYRELYSPVVVGQDNSEHMHGAVLMHNKIISSHVSTN